MEVQSKKIALLRDQLWNELNQHLTGIIRNGSIEHALPNNLNVSVSGIDGAAMFGRFKNIAVSNASACVSGVQDYSQVLTELGVTPALAKATMRFGISRFNQEQEIKTAAMEVVGIVKTLREMEKLYDHVNR
jgi:cysteine desulfurase